MKHSTSHGRIKVGTPMSDKRRRLLMSLGNVSPAVLTTFIAAENALFHVGLLRNIGTFSEVDVFSEFPVKELRLSGKIVEVILVLTRDTSCAADSVRDMTDLNIWLIPFIKLLVFSSLGVSGDDSVR